MDSKIKNLHFRRALILQDIAIVEKAMNHLICLYFIGTLNFEGKSEKRFISELLQNPYFSFELRKRLFQSAYKKLYPDSKFPWKSLEEVQRLRNIIVHTRMDERILTYPDGKKVSEEPFYSYHDEEIGAESLHTEFKTNLDIVIAELNVIKSDIKIVYTPEPIIEIE